MLRLHLEGVGDLQNLALPALGEALAADDVEFARRQGAGLVQRHDVDIGEFLDRGAAPEKDAVAGPPGDRGEDRRGNRQDEGAWAGHDHERHRAVEGRAGCARVFECGQAEGEPADEEHRQGPADHNVGVAGPEPVGEALARSLELLGRLDEPDDLLKGALRGRPQDVEFDRSPKIQGPAEDLVAFGLGHGHRLAGKGGLVACAPALGHHAVRGKRLPGLDPDALADPEGLDGDLLIASVGKDDIRALRRSLQQGPHLPLGPVERVLLHRTGRREKEKKEDRLAPGADADGARRDRQHEKMNVDFPVADVLPGVDRRVPAAGDKARAEKKPREKGNGRQEVPHQHSGQARDSADGGQPGEGPPLLLLGRGLRLDLRPLHLPPEPEFFRRFAGFPAEDHRLPFPAQQVAAREPAGLPSRQPLLDTRDRGRECGLELLQVDASDRRHRHPVRRRIDPDRIHAGPGAQELGQLADPVRRLVRFPVHLCETVIIGE